MIFLFVTFVNFALFSFRFLHLLCFDRPNFHCKIKAL
nr:MAG TPA: hypothetical protein [Caudoviricetes sp.]